MVRSFSRPAAFAFAICLSCRTAFRLNTPTMTTASIFLEEGAFERIQRRLSSRRRKVGAAVLSEVASIGYAEYAVLTPL
jgi:hypothetical protein